MSKTYRVSFIGNEQIRDAFKYQKRLMKIVNSLLEENESVEFYFRTRCEIGLFATLNINANRSKFDNKNIKLVLILNDKKECNDFFKFEYDDIKYSTEFNNPFNSLEQINEWLIDNCDLLITCVEKKTDYMTSILNYANDKKVKQINLAKK